MPEPLTRRRTLIDELRQRVKRKLGYCRTCGQATKLNTREAAKMAGIPHTNLWRFLSGKAPSAATVDALARWLGVGWKP